MLPCHNCAEIPFCFAVSDPDFFISLMAYTKAVSTESGFHLSFLSFFNIFVSESTGTDFRTPSFQSVLRSLLLPLQAQQVAAARATVRDVYFVSLPHSVSLTASLIPFKRENLEHPHQIILDFLAVESRFL